MSRSNFLDFLSRGWSRLRFSHEVEHSKSRQEERSSELQATCLLSCTWHACLIAGACQLLSDASCKHACKCFEQVTVCSTVITVATNL